MTLTEYQQKWNGFERHLLRVSINGSEIDGETLLYRSVDVTLTSGFEASECVLKLIGQWTKMEESGVKLDEVMEKFVLGAKFELKLGYGTKDDAVDVFKGYISTIEFDMEGEEAVLTVHAMDAKQFMMSSFRSVRFPDTTKYSDAVTEVLGKYSSVQEGTDVEATTEITSPVEQHNLSDYEFVVSLAKRLNYLFYVLSGKVYFVSYSKFTDSLVSIEPGGALFSLHREVTLSDQVKSVTVRAQNQLDPDSPFEATATAVTAVGGGDTAGNEASTLIGESMQKIVVVGSVKSVAEATDQAQALLDEMAMKFVSGDALLAGIPEILPGHMLTLAKINDSYNGDYFIRQVVHHMDKDKFTTAVKFSGSKYTKPA